ncbi:hypothetical protein B0H10DRAFT_2162254 [Mycena sp. CBHHK59/15]|nr:hypothetical protein B0H10DRAFT_2162254 [Mycena sp. CBHHK59/15]
MLSSSPMHTPRVERKMEMERREAQRQATRAQNRLAAKAAQDQKEKESAEAAAAAEERKAEHFAGILDGLEEQHYSLADFLEYVFNPSTEFATGYDWRWGGFFAHKKTVKKIFGYWSSSVTRAGRTFVFEWAYGLVKKMVSSESRRITRSGILNKANMTVNEDFFLKYSLTGLSRKLRKMSPRIFGIFDAFSTTTRQLKDQSTVSSKKFLKKQDVLTGSAALALMNGASQNNSYSQAVHGTYLMATGGQRQHFSILHGFGWTMGYTSIITQSSGTTTSKAKKKRMRTPGTLFLLSQACRATARAIAATGLFLIVYDNINMMVRIAEQILGRKNTQENGTCATVIPLHDATLNALLTADLDKSIANAPPLSIENLEFTEAEGTFFRKNMIHTILRMIVRYGGESFDRWKKDLDESQPVSADQIALHRTPIHPVPAMEIDENSTKGNIEVIEATNTELELDEDDPNYAKYVKIIAGDQLTIARQRSILQVRLGHESGAQAWKHIVLMPGLFHAKIADLMDHLPITLTSLPPFRTCRDLIMVSLYARILHCLLLVSGKDTLEDYADSCDSWDTLVSHAKGIYDTYANTQWVQELRDRRAPEERRRDAELAAQAKGKKTSASDTTKKEYPPHVKIGDMVFENALLFIRDALLTREFSDAIKKGDSGRIALVLKQFAFTYRGNGRTKYAHEMLHVLHNIVNVWSDELRHVILHNWVLNPTGKLNAFVEVDLVQEHLNLWIKKIYKADGDAHSWDWLAFVSPCVDVLRRLATRLNTDLGARQGNKHTIPDLTKDITSLMASLQEHEVYVLKEGRVLDDDELPAPDVLSVGAAALTHGAMTNPLQDFNDQFDQLRRRRELIPVSDLLQYLPGASPESGLGPAPTVPAASDGLPDTITFFDGDGLTSERLPREDVQLPQLSPPPSPPASEDEGEYDEDLFAQSPTLTRLETTDVDLDMDDDWALDGEYDSESEYDAEEVPMDERSGSESD